MYSGSDYKQNVWCLDWAFYICWGSSTSCEGPTTNIKQTVVDVSPKLCLKHLDLKRLDVLWVWSAEMYLTNICHKFAKFSFETKKVGTGAPIEQNDICIEGPALFHREGRMHTTNIHINSTRKSICHLSSRFWSPYFIHLTTQSPKSSKIITILLHVTYVTKSAKHFWSDHKRTENY